MLELTHTRDRIADSPCFKIRQWQGQHMAKQLCAQAHVDSIRRVREQIAPQSTEQGIEQRQRHHTYRQHMQGGKAFMDKDFIDHDLRKEWRQQPKELKKEGGGYHLAQQAAIFHDGWNEPGKVKGQIGCRKGGALGGKQELTRPDRRKLSLCQNGRALLAWIVYQYFFAIDLRHDNIATILTLGHGRERHPRKM